MPPPATALLDAAVSRAAKARGIPVNVVDAPELSTFIMPAIVDRDPVTVAIGTEGAAPVLAREIKTRLETLLPANFGSARQARAGPARHRRQDRPRRRAPAAACGSGCCKVPSAAPSSRGAEDEAGRILAAELHGGDRPAAARAPAAWR